MTIWDQLHSEITHLREENARLRDEGSITKMGYELLGLTPGNDPVRDRAMRAIVHKYLDGAGEQQEKQNG